MKTFGVVNSFAAMLLLFLTPSTSVPSRLIGKWKIGRGYATPGAIGIDQEKENRIRHFELVYSSTSFHVCGKEVPIRTVESHSLTPHQFAEESGFLPRLIGMGEANVTEVTINWSNHNLMGPNDWNACGDFADPGTTVYIGKNGHIVIEVANDYMPLEKE